jgi:hypothetical protein
MRVSYVAVLGALVPLLGGCEYLKAANADKPSSEQTRALGDVFGEVGTVASIADDPAGTSNEDLATAMTFTPFVRLVAPETAMGLAPARLLAPRRAAGVPGCITMSGNDRVFNCDVTLPDGRACLVTGTLTRKAGETGNDYAGTLSLHGGAETCPTASVTLDVRLEGPTNMPTLADGTMSFSYHDLPTYDYTGTGTFDHIAITAKCPNLPSTGELTIAVQGTAHGVAVNESVTLSFHDTPGCGLIYVE